MKPFKKSPGHEISLIKNDELNLPPILEGHENSQIRDRVEHFYRSVANLFEVWLQRSASYNTQRTYRASVMAFIDFKQIDWENESWQLLQTTVEDVRQWRASMMYEEQAPNTINHRISSLSGFFTFLRETSTEQRLPMLVPNPAHKDFIKREVALPVNETQALSISQARQLLQLPQGNSPLAKRDQAILAFYLYTGARIGTGCRLDVQDFLNDPDDSKIKIQEKGKGRSKRTIGLNLIAAQILEEYLKVANISSGKLFRKQKSSRTENLGDEGIKEGAMYAILMRYLYQLPKATQLIEQSDGSETLVCRYSPHSLRATTATLLLDAGVSIVHVQQLLGHAQVTTTQTYNKRRLQSKDSASHKVPF